MKTITITKTRGELMFALSKNRNLTSVQNQCRGEPYVRPPNINRNRTYVREYRTTKNQNRTPYTGFENWVDFGYCLPVNIHPIKTSFQFTRRPKASKGIFPPAIICKADIKSGRSTAKSPLISPLQDTIHSYKRNVCWFR